MSRAINEEDIVLICNLYGYTEIGYLIDDIRVDIVIMDIVDLFLNFRVVRRSCSRMFHQFVAITFCTFISNLVYKKSFWMQ